jgi:Rad3-related DNA helicase
MNNEKMLETHFNSPEPTVLVSPSLSHGTDLNGDKGRFQIIVKTPYPPLSNKRIKKKFDLDKNWYSDKTINSLIQMSGRCTRSKQDHSVTYILDGTAFKLIKDNVNVLPQHFIERIV